MKNVALMAQKDRIDYLFQKISQVGDIELQSHWARYLCVLTSGFIELCVRTILTEYVRKNASPLIVNFVERKLRHFQNANMNKILDIIESFNPIWRDTIQTAVDEEQKDAIDSVVANKNNIVHGNITGITYIRIKEYYEKSIRVIELVEDKCR